MVNSKEGLLPYELRANAQVIPIKSKKFFPFFVKSPLKYSTTIFIYIIFSENLNMSIKNFFKFIIFIIKILKNS